MIYNFISRSENRQIFGLRTFSQNQKRNHELECTYQIRTFSNQNISFAIDGAYFIAGNYVKETGKLNILIYIGISLLSELPFVKK